MPPLVACELHPILRRIVLVRWVPHVSPRNVECPVEFAVVQVEGHMGRRISGKYSVIAKELMTPPPCRSGDFWDPLLHFALQRVRILFPESCLWGSSVNPSGEPSHEIVALCRAFAGGCCLSRPTKLPVKRIRRAPRCSLSNVCRTIRDDRSQFDNCRCPKE
jgi:hypothetical protein